MRFFCVTGGFVCGAGYTGKEEPVSMHGGCEEKARGKLGTQESPDTFFGGNRINKLKIKNQNAKIQIKYKKGNLEGQKIFFERAKR